MIGYYVHHHGHGHLHRALSLAQQLDEPVVGLSSRPPPADAPFADWVQLAPDDAFEGAADLHAGGALHWAPINSPGYERRMHQLARWVAQDAPRLVVVDVSVEVAALIRLLGTPTVVVTLPGGRADDPHTTAYRLAAAIVAPWPGEVYDPPHLTAHAGKVVFTGAFSRFDGKPAGPVTGDKRALLLLGSGGTDVPVATGRSAGWQWSTLGGAGRWSDDVWTALQDADVVVTHAGLNALAEVAAARRPAIVVPQGRPFDEQRTTGDALRSAGLATVLDAWPAAGDWPGLLDAAAAQGQQWTRWNDGRGAARFARVVTEVAHGG
ncbi:glycosyltransferase [uncultured Jatrophihabitans sp.]|uniref:glycosyltransferase n=1 Tax=uncultured Jatrophihabitans sp. TaxID=1610747 RepID=UPI0035CC5780